MNIFFGFKVLLFSFLLIYINCCSPGHYLLFGKCTPCKSGYYSEGTNSTTKLIKCEECPEGTYSGKGSSKCIPCPAGTFSKSKSSECHNCPKGTYSKKGDSLCTPCPEKYFSDTEGSPYCKKCPDNTNSYKGSFYCYECPEGDKACSDSDTKKNKIKRNNSEKNDGIKDELKEFGKSMTSLIFGKKIEFENYVEIFDIPHFQIIATIFDEISFDIKKDIHFFITNHRFSTVEYVSYEILQNIIEFANKIIDALKGEFTISIPYLENKIGENIANGEVSVTYYLLLNQIEVTIISKLSNDMGNENIVGVKFKIIPKPDSNTPVEELNPVKDKEENYLENLIGQLLKKSYEYIYIIIDFLKSPEVLAVIGGITVMALTFGILLAISGVSIPALISAAAAALGALLQNGLSLFGGIA